jgi:hypothetical protein
MNYIRKCISLILFNDFDSALQSNESDVKKFLESLMTLCHCEGKRVKLLFSVHSSDNAVTILRLSTDQAPIFMIQPITCCRWTATDLDEYFLSYKQIVNDFSMDACSTAGCPEIENMEQALELQIQWAMGEKKIKTFLDRQWNISGAFQASNIADLNLRVRA